MNNSYQWSRITEEQRAVISSFHEQYPVAVGKIAKAFGIRIIKASLIGNIAGEIKETEGVITIKVNAHDVKARQRYTIAHEIAHFLLHRHLLREGIEDTTLYRSHLPGKIEREADALAADILMPLKFVQPLLVQYSDLKGEAVYEAVAASLEVSPIALKIRLGKE